MEIADIIEPRALSVPAGNVPQKVIEFMQDMLAYDFFIQVRSMGDASYIAVGTSGAQEDRLLGVGDYRSYQVPGRLVNIGTLFVSSDATSILPVVELSGTYHPGGGAVI